MITGQTHFIGVLVPDELTTILQECRGWMNAHYGCRSGYGTPVHITLVPPFCLNEQFSHDDVRRAVQDAVRSWSEDHSPFNCMVDGFGSFSGRTLFAYVKPSPEWEQLRDAVSGALLKQCPGTIRKDTRPFTPHLTVANRDIPAGAEVSALTHFAELNLKETFQVNNVTVFVRRNGKWISDTTFAIEV
jgi:2'-5' RNA ligase